jgi:hypothetical protein
MWELIAFVGALVIVAILIGLITDASARNAAARGEQPPQHH